MIQADLLPGEQRSALLALLRLPLTAVAAGGMLWLHDGSAHGDSHLLSLCAFLIFFALVLSLALQHLLGPRAELEDHFVLPSTAATTMDEQ